VNAYEVRQAWCLLQVKLCDPCLSALKWFVYHARRYTSARLTQNKQTTDIPPFAYTMTISHVHYRLADLEMSR